MHPKFRLYRRSNRTYSAQNTATGGRESLCTKDRDEARKLLQAKNDSHAQPILSRELAKVYLQSQDPRFGKRTWGDVARLIDSAYQGNTKERFQKFLRSEPVKRLMSMRLVETGSSDFLDVFAHPKAGVSANVQVRTLHNRALDLEWILRPVLAKKAWPKVRYGHRRGITGGMRVSSIHGPCKVATGAWARIAPAKRNSPWSCSDCSSGSGKVTAGTLRQ